MGGACDRHRTFTRLPSPGAPDGDAREVPSPAQAEKGTESFLLGSWA